MAIRLLELVLPAGEGDTIEQWLADDVADIWRGQLTDERFEVKLLVESQNTEAVLDKLEQRFGHLKDFRVMLMRVDVALPKPPEKPKEGKREKSGSRSVSRQELRDSMVRDTKVSANYITMVVLSVVVAAIGLIYDNVAVLIAAMIIAPLLGANMALALATTTGDSDLARAALKVNATGVSIGFGLALLLGMFLPEHLIHSDEISSRTIVRPSDFALALAAGAAGTMAFTSGVSGTLIGVMVAVALMPPLIVVGMTLGAGMSDQAIGASLLLGTNVICLNLAAVLTFALQGVRPRKWWEANRAKRATGWAIGIWVLLLLVLAGLVYVISQREGWFSAAVS